MPSSNRILEGVRIIAFTNGYAGPYGGRLLAQYGAEVIKVESMSGGLDSFRHFGAAKDINASPRFLESNLGVRSLTLNLKHPVGLRLIKELAARSDAVFDNYRPHVLSRLGLGEEELKKANPGIVILKMPGLGTSGPKSWYGTWGLTLTAFCGMTHLWNHPGQPRPVGSQGVYPDHVGFILAPTLLVAALLRRRLTGEGVSIDMAQVEATAYLLGAIYMEAEVNGSEPQPKGNIDPTASPHGCFPCQGQDRWCVLSVRTNEEWKRFCKVMGRDDLSRAELFADPAARVRNAAEVNRVVEEWTRRHTAEDVMRRLQEAGIAAGAVQNGADLTRDPQLRHRNYFNRFSESPIGPVELPRSALQFEGLEDEALSLAPVLGQHTDQILQDILGYDAATIGRWKEEGILS